MEHGFTVSADPLEKNNRIWNYWKKTGDLLHVVYIVDSFDYINLSVRTNAYGQNTAYAMYFAPQDRYSGSHRGWPYKDEAKFIEILEEMRGLLLDCGFQELERISVSTTNIRPTPENNRFLRDHWEEVALKYREELNLDSKTYEEQFEFIMEMIKKEEDKNFEEVEPLLVDIAAVYGDFLIRCFGGECTWIDEYNNFFIKKIGTCNGGCSPLLRVITMWRYKKY